MAAPTITLDMLKTLLAKGDCPPVSIVHGEEGYYVDEAVNMFEQYLPEADRDFNLYILYAPQVQPEQILDVCRRFPMMSERQVVIVKEMQAVSADYGEKLSGYVSQPTATTMLLLAGRGGALKSKGLVTTAKAHGAAVIEAKRVDERSVAPLISGYVKSKGLAIEAKGLSMLRDYVGTDLSRLYNEIAKLAIVLPPGATITPEVIERNIGISKDYNNFELIDAVATKDAERVYRITEYFRMNPKNNPTVLTASQLFRFFSNLMIVWFTRDRSDASLMAALGMKWPRALQSYKVAMRHYNAYQTIEIISAIRQFDVRSKGVGSRSNEYDLLRELMFHILNAPGRIDV